MAGFVEVHVKGDCRAFLGSSDFAGVLTPPGLGATALAAPETPLSIILKSGSTIDGIYGISASKLLVYMAGVRIVLKEFGRPMVVVFIDERTAFENDLAQALDKQGSRHDG